MPSPSISNGSTTHAFITLRGQPQVLGMMLEDVTRPGVSGHAFREVALQAEPYELEGRRDCDSNADAGALFAAMVAAHQGKVVTVVDDLGKSYAGHVCLRVQRVDSFRLAKASGGVSAQRGAFLVVRFTLQATT